MLLGYCTLVVFSMVEVKWTPMRIRNSYFGQKYLPMLAFIMLPLEIYVEGLVTCILEVKSMHAFDTSGYSFGTLWTLS